MANAPLHKCNTAGCNQLTRQSRCDKHAKEKRTQPEHRPNSYQRGYDKAWYAVRAVKLMEQPLCEDCTIEGITTAAEEVHHIEKIADKPDLRLDIDNLMSLCKTHHSRRTARGE